MSHPKPWNNSEVTKIAVCLANLGVSQISYLALKNAPKQQETDVILFFEDIQQPCIRPLNAAMCISELWCYECDLAIATDLSTAVKLMNIPGPKKKLFYVWDLEFVQNHQGQPLKNFLELVKIYCSPEFELVARTEEYAQIIEKTFGRKVAFIMNDMDFKLEPR